MLCYRDEYVKALGPARGDFQVLLPRSGCSLPAEALPLREEAGTDPWYLFAHCTEKTAKPTTHGD